MKVSVICPTNRKYNIDRLVKIFLAQDYPDKELTFAIDDNEGLDLSWLGSNPPFDDPPVGTYWDKSAKTIGEKRNRLVNGANGEIIVHFDDDDYYAPDYISRAVKLLIESKANIVGLSKAYFYKPHSNLWLYTSPSKAYVIGSGMTYYRTVWEKKGFPDKNSGEDLDFQTNAGKIAQLDYLNGFMAIIHGNNTASHNSLSVMKRVNPDIAHSVLGEAYELY